MNDPKLNDEIYDAKVTLIDEEAAIVVFNADGVSHCVGAVHSPRWEVGTVGRLRLPSDRGAFSFLAYPDQRLSRDRSQDDPRLELWGWKLGPQRIACKAGIIPGRDGLVVSQDTELSLLELPREYLHLCRACRLSPETVLRGFVADLCSLMNWAHCPREDGYSSNGSDERRLAREYFQRAYEWIGDTEETRFRIKQGG